MSFCSYFQCDTKNWLLLSCFLSHCRLLVSGFLQKESEFFANFIEGERTMKEFCAQVRLYNTSAKHTTICYKMIYLTDWYGSHCMRSFIRTDANWQILIQRNLLLFRVHFYHRIIVCYFKFCVNVVFPDLIQYNTKVFLY